MTRNTFTRQQPPIQPPIVAVVGEYCLPCLRVDGRVGKSSDCRFSCTGFQSRSELRVEKVAPLYNPVSVDTWRVVYPHLGVWEGDGENATKRLLLQVCLKYCKTPNEKKRLYWLPYRPASCVRSRHSIDPLPSALSLSLSRSL
jgi:hypothetical protein